MAPAAKSASPSKAALSSAEKSSDPSSAHLVDAAIKQFYDPSSEEDARFASVRVLGGFARNWIEQATVPFPPEEQADAEAVAEAFAFLAMHAGPWIDASRVDEFQDHWLHLVERDREAGGTFGSRVIWRELQRRLELLIFTGQLEEALRVIGQEGTCRIENAPSPWDVYLRATRAGIYRLTGEFQLALDDLDAASERIHEEDWEAQLHVAQHRFSVETDLGRLEMAEKALGTITRLVKARGDHAGARLKSLLWQARVLQLLSTGNNSQALEFANQTLRNFGEDLLLSASGMRRRDQLLYLAALAGHRVGQHPVRQDPGPPAEGPAPSLGNVTYLAQDSFLDHFSRQLAHLLQVSMAHAQGEDGEALELLQSFRADERDPSRRDEAAARLKAMPLFATRIAALRYEVALAAGDPQIREEAGFELQSAFEGLLSVWRRIAIQPSGVGFLQFAERRHALHLVLESTLRKGPGQGEHALAWLLAADSCSTIARHLDAGEPTPADVMELCGSLGVTLVYFVPTESVTHRFTVRATGLSHDRLEGEEEFRMHFGPVLAALRERPPEEDTPWPPADASADLEWLSERFLPDGDRDGDALLYAGLGAFGFNPVEVLPDRSGLPIGLTREITQTPSVTALWRLGELAEKSRPDSPQQRLSIFSLSGPGRDVDTGKQVPSIGFSLAEYNQLVATSAARVSYERAASETVSGLVQAIESGPDLFVALTHGSEEGGRGDLPGLYVRSETDGPGGRQVLRPHELNQRLVPSLTARPSVALIAACSAGVGPRRMGDSGASDFSGSLLGSGIPTVLTATERIDREAGVAFIMAFTRQLLGEKQSVARSALLARRALASQPRFAHPHFWAPLQLFGWSGTHVR